ncbi:MAG TPA: proton-conducting transporter membrane subunit, partial [Candidatus Baltobacteraceae bacterium]|nr:proton-conducting transporter membrane subunit [Candidatus Baltobacteraceae bacterium]
MSLFVPVLAPLIAAVLSSIVPQAARRISRALTAAAAMAMTLAALPQLDRLSAIFAAVVSLIAFAATLFSGSLFPEAVHDGSPWQRRPVYFMLLGAFWSSMLYTLCSTTFIGLWAGISATTLTTTFLVGYSGGKAALEAAWKYLLLCSVGVGIALVGMLLLGRAGMQAGIAPADALSWAALTHRNVVLSGDVAPVALVLMLIGFGTKAGLVPMHAWLPDAHSKAPSPISALLSGLLVSSALYAIMRVQGVASYAGVEAFDHALLVLGAASMLVASVLMLAQRDVKRLLSYSTVEQSGLVALALGIGTPFALFAALYHTINHAFTKSTAFFAIGLVQHQRGTTAIASLQGLWNDRSGKLLLAALAGLAGFPPFGLFVSELLIVIAAVAAHQWAALACALLALTLGFAALARLAIETECGVPTSMPRVRAPRVALAGAAATACI